MFTALLLQQIVWQAKCDSQARRRAGMPNLPIFTGFIWTQNELLFAPAAATRQG